MSYTNGFTSEKRQQRKNVLELFEFYVAWMSSKRLTEIPISIHSLPADLLHYDSSFEKQAANICNDNQVKFDLNCYEKDNATYKKVKLHDCFATANSFFQKGCRGISYKNELLPSTQTCIAKSEGSAFIWRDYCGAMQKDLLDETFNDVIGCDSSFDIVVFTFSVSDTMRHKQSAPTKLRNKLIEVAGDLRRGAEIMEDYLLELAKKSNFVSNPLFTHHYKCSAKAARMISMAFTTHSFLASWWIDNCKNKSIATYTKCENVLREERNKLEKSSSKNVAFGDKIRNEFVSGVTREVTMKNYNITRSQYGSYIAHLSPNLAKKRVNKT